MAAFFPIYLPRLVKLDKADKKRNEENVSDSENPSAKKLKMVVLGGVPANQCMVQAGLVLANSVSVCYGAT